MFPLACIFFISQDEPTHQTLLVATINFAKTFKGHGWMGIRFQTEASRETNEIIIHFRLGENEAKHQQETRVVDDGDIFGPSLTTLSCATNA